MDTPHGLIQLNTQTGSCIVMVRDAKGALAREALEAPQTAGAVVWTGQAKHGVFELAVAKLGTLLHDTRSGAVWQLESNSGGKLVWASTDPDAPRPGDAYLGIRSEGTDKGLRITQVHPGIAAAAVGLQPGGILERADDAELKTDADLRKAVRARKAGDTLKLRVRREVGNEIVRFALEVTLGAYK